MYGLQRWRILNKQSIKNNTVESSW